MNDPLKQYIQDHREEFDTLEAPEEAFEKIMFRLNEPTASMEKTIPLFPWKKWVAAASVVIIFGLGSYTLWNQKESEKPVIVNKIKITTEDKKNIAALEQNSEWEVEKEAVAEQENVSKVFVSTNSDVPGKSGGNLNLIQNNHSENRTDFEKTEAIELINDPYSASSRLKGIALIKDHLASDGQLINVLSEKARSDENTNVRLAAVEALFAHIEIPAISKNVRQIFLHQDDPVVQKELIAFLREKSPSGLNGEVSTRLKELTMNPSTAIFVKDEAYAVLMNY